MQITFFGSSSGYAQVDTENLEQRKAAFEAILPDLNRLFPSGQQFSLRLREGKIYFVQSKIQQWTPITGDLDQKVCTLFSKAPKVTVEGAADELPTPRRTEQPSSPKGTIEEPSEGEVSPPPTPHQTEQFSQSALPPEFRFQRPVRHPLPPNRDSESSPEDRKINLPSAPRTLPPEFRFRGPLPLNGSEAPEEEITLLPSAPRTLPPEFRFRGSRLPLPPSKKKRPSPKFRFPRNPGRFAAFEKQYLKPKPKTSLPSSVPLLQHHQPEHP